MSVIDNKNSRQDLIRLAADMGQATSAGDDSLGFGYVYYGLTRLFRPQVILCIGSFRGFSPVCFTLGLADNRQGKCYFIDPGKVDGYWHDENNFSSLNSRFGLDNRMTHFKKTSQEVVASRVIKESIDLLFIDGDHSYAGVKFDFDHFSPMVQPGGLLLLHDSITQGVGFTRWEVKNFLETEVYGKGQYEHITLPLAAGLSIFRKPG